MRMAEKPSRTPAEVAEIVAIRALAFLAGEAQLLGQFLSESGIGPQTLRASAADPRFLAGVLDFIMRNDDTVKAFSDFSQFPPPTIAAAREALGETLHG
jgi:hypothetical protein